MDTNNKKGNQIRVLIEGAACPIIGSQIGLMREAQYIVVAIDIHPVAAGLYLADKGFVVPPYSDEESAWETINEILKKENIDLVIPTVDEGLIFWAERREELLKRDVFVLVSDVENILPFMDKYETFKYLSAAGVSTPDTSIEPRFGLTMVKPRKGRGSKGITVYNDKIPKVDHQRYVYQQVISGFEYTIDLLCDNPGSVLYCVSRSRIVADSGISTYGKVVSMPEIEAAAKRIAEKAKLFGPVNMQCIVNDEGFYFIDINPRTSGGQALTMRATENWYKLYPKIVRGNRLKPTKVKTGEIMMRYYNEHYLSDTELLNEL